MYAVLAAGLSASAHADPAGVFEILDWEDPADRTLPPPGWNRQYCCSHSAQPVGGPVRQGGYAMRFELNKSDPLQNSSKRAELSQPSNQQPNVERWYGFSILLPSSWVYDQSSEIVSQWHQQSNSGSPPLALLTSKGNWKIDFRGTVIDLGSYHVGRWTDWVFHVKWFVDRNGLLEVWRDGAQVLRRTGPTHNETANSPYFKFGIYKWDWDGRPKPSDTIQRIMFYDALRLGDARANYADVAPQVTECGSSSAGQGWSNQPHAGQTGRFATTFEATPSVAGIDAVIGISATTGTTFTDFAALIRFNPDGIIDVRNGAGYGATTRVPFAANANYRFRVTVDVPARRYSVDVSTPDGALHALARDFAFRSEQAGTTSVANIGFIVAGPAGALTLCNVRWPA